MMKKILQNNTINYKDITFLVPAGGEVNSACNYKLSSNENGFLNIGTTLAIEKIRQNTSSKIVLAVTRKSNKVFKLNQFENTQIVEIGRTKNITETIKITLDSISTEWCLINPITTIPVSNSIDFPFIEFGSEVLPKENWSSIVFDNKGIPIFLSKLDNKSKNSNSYPFTGRILAKTKDIKLTIKKLKKNEKNDLFFLAKSLYLESKVKIIYTNWLDIGHTATYPLTRIFTITSRFFNELVFNKKKNTITKTSQDKLKINQEIKFYKTIPKELKRYFPVIFNEEESESLLSYEMDYVPNPSLAEIYLFGELRPNAVMRIFKSIDLIFETFYHKSKTYSVEDASWLYTKKTISRQQALENTIKKKKYKVLEAIYKKDIFINNIKFPSLKNLFSLLKKELDLLENERPLHIGHGDLCFNNILVDPIFGKINLIDPKAEKHPIHNIYGLIDNYYDLAKLNHSIEGLYDSIVNNLYCLKIFDNNNVSLQIYKPKEYKIYNNYFREILCEKRINYDELRLLTANLFLTMLPLHSEDEKRIIVLSLIGSLLLQKKSLETIML